ncbi:hypothetical protein CLBKND_04746 [Methylorubrum aminovorans]
MGVCWHKERWLPGELDTVTGQPLPGVMPPGIYCEDEATFEALASAPGVERVTHVWPQREGADPMW